MAEIQQLRADILELDREIRRLRAEQQQRGAGDFVRANAIVGVIPSANIPAHGSIGLWTNQSGGALGIGAIVIQNGDRQFDTTTTADDLDVVGVLTEAIANTAEGRLRHQGYHPSVIVEGAVVAGQFLRTSTTAGAAEDAGTIPTEGVFGMALTAAAGPGAGTVAAYLFGTIGALTADSVYLPRVSGSTYDDVEDMQTTMHSTGWINGGVISDAGGATIDVTAGAGLIRASDSRTAQLLFFDWSASAGLAIAADSIRYIGVEYNAGAPQVTVRATENWDYNTDFPLGIVVNEGGTLHIQEHEHAIGDHADFMIRRMHQTAHIQRDNELNGNILGESGDNNRNVQVSAGAYWIGLSRFTTSAFDSSGADTFDTYSAGGLEAAGVSVWPNTQYDNAGVLTVMTNNRWANLWFYQELDGDIVMVYGTAQYTTEAMAGEEELPTTLPDRIVVHGILIGRYIFQKSDTVPAQIASAFINGFAVAGVTDHGGLTGLLDDDHTQYLLADGTRALSGDWAAGAFSITADNVTIKDGSIELHHGTDTIVGDEIVSPTGGYIIAAAQAGVADDLDGIGGGANGRLIVVRADAGDTITVRHNNAGGGAGRKILLNNNEDLVLVGDDEDSVTLLYDESLDSGNGAWFDITQSVGTSISVTKQVPLSVRGLGTVNAETIAMLGYEDGVTDGNYFTGVVPDDWDGVSDMTVKIWLFQSATAGNPNCVLRSYITSLDTGEGFAWNIDNAANADAALTQNVIEEVTRTLAAGSLTKGDGLLWHLLRLGGDAGDDVNGAVSVFFGAYLEYTAVAVVGGGGGALAAHDHTVAGGDGGVLTNDEHDGYSEYTAIATPAVPAAGDMRFFVRISGSRIQLIGQGLTGEECVICDVSNVVAPANTLALNWIE